MKAEIKKLPKSEIELTITVSYATYSKWEKKALEDISMEINIPGFRPGHMPEDIIRKNVNPDAVKAATLDYILPQTYTQAVKENNLQVIAQPNIEIKKDIAKEGDDFVYIAKVAVMPEVTMGDYKKIKIQHKKVQVEKKNVDDAIKMLLDRFAQWQNAERPAKNGDRVEIEFSGFDEKGNLIPNTSSKNHPVILGSNTMVPGFEDSIVGMNKGETKESKIKFPKDYHAKDMQDKDVKFKITLNRTEEKIEQELDEAVIEKITGKKQNIEEFRKLVEQDIKMEMEARNQQEHDNKVVTEIMKITKAEIPEVLISQELDAMLEDQRNRVKEQGIEWDQYLTHIKKTEDDFKKENRKLAEDRIIARLGVQHIIGDAKISATDKETDAKIQEIASKYPEEQRKGILDYYKDKQAFDFLKNNMAADKLINMLSTD